MEDLVKYNNLMHGYSGESVLKLDQDIVAFAIEMSTMRFKDDYELRTEGHSKNTIRLNSRKFLESKFRLYDVPFATDSMVIKKLDGKDISSSLELVELYNSAGILISPFKVPVNYVDKPYYYGLTELQKTDCFDEDFLQRMTNFVKSIQLSNKISEFSSLCHIHEVVHLQTERIKGIVTSYLNSEVLSIFLELVYAFEHDESGSMFRRSYLNRLNYFFVEFDDLFKYEQNGSKKELEFKAAISSKYIVSILIAFNLFDLYLKGGTLLRKVIMSKIQEVFDGKSTLEEILTELGISYETSIKKDMITKVLIPS